MFKIGNIEIKNNIVLAPMAGISNPAYIKICEEMGLGYAITELISAEAIVRNNKKTFDMLKGIENINIPLAVQIFGDKPDVMAKAAKILVDEYNIKIIDINMGCPVPKVALKSNSGSALLKDPKKTKQIVEEVIKAVNVPVTAKIRSGWDNNSINALEISKMLEEAGISAITIHPRTRSQGYSGLSDWNIIKEVKANVNIPVIGNGDIKSPLDAKKMLDETKCDAIMIGRGLLGNPWLIKECIEYLETGLIKTNKTNLDIINMIKKHYLLLEQNKSEHLALLEMRTNVAWYLKGLNNSSKLKEQIFKVKTKQEFMDLLDNFIKEMQNESKL